MAEREPNIAERALNIVTGIAACLGKRALHAAENLGGGTHAAVQNIHEVWDDKAAGTIDALEGLVPVVEPEQQLAMEKEKICELAEMFLRDKSKGGNDLELHRSLVIALSELSTEETWETIGFTEYQTKQLRKHL